MTLYNWSRPRDLAHYEDFEHYHATFYRQVEALSVTPYTRRALDRGTAATFVAAVRNVDRAVLAQRRRAGRDLDGPIVAAVDRPAAATGPRPPRDQRGRDYLAERIDALRGSAGSERKTGSTRLGYRKRTGKQPLTGLLDAAGGGTWTDLTVADVDAGDGERDQPAGPRRQPLRSRCTASPPGRSPSGTTNRRQGPDDDDDLPTATNSASRRRRPGGGR